MPYTPVKKAIELFHLLFLAQLGTKVDKRRFTLKGGCNLRFFFKSPRYSEDMDLDVRGIPVEKLKEKVDGITASKSFSMLCAAHGIRIDHINNDKQTATTQRWKFGLGITGIALPVPTKIECSRRGNTDEGVFEQIDPMIIAHHGIPPFLTSHYPRQNAYHQKLRALIDRTQTQARDVFDIHLLLAGGAAAGDLPADLKQRIDQAREHVWMVDFDMFRDQVLDFLPPEQQATYDATTWDAMRLFVIHALEEAARATA
jgi:hypothetical protein